MRSSAGVDLAFMLMNSFATSADTLEHLAKYPLATQGLPLEFQQNKAPHPQHQPRPQPQHQPQPQPQH